jgi:hypothetical protein
MSLTNRRPEGTTTANDLTRRLTYAVFPKAHDALETPLGQLAKWVEAESANM